MGIMERVHSVANHKLSNIGVTGGATLAGIKTATAGKLSLPVIGSVASLPVISSLGSLTAVAIGSLVTVAGGYQLLHHLGLSEMLGLEEE